MRRRPLLGNDFLVERVFCWLSLDYGVTASMRSVDCSCHKSWLWVTIALRRYRRHRVSDLHIPLVLVMHHEDTNVTGSKFKEMRAGIYNSFALFALKSLVCR